MRRVEIKEMVGEQYRWQAIDSKTGKPVLRLEQLEMLLGIAQSLDWIVIQPRSSKRRA